MNHHWTFAQTRRLRARRDGHVGVPSKTIAMRRRRMHVECAVIAAVISTASSVMGATCAIDLRNLSSESGAHGTVLTALIRPAPVGEVITPEPPQVPAPTVRPIAPTVAAPPPRAEQPVAPPPQQEAPPPQREAPAPQQEGPAPQQEGPSPEPEPPPSPPPPRGHVRLAP